MKKKEHKFQQSVNIHLGAVCAECGDSILAHDHEPPKNPKPLMPNAVDSVVLRKQIETILIGHANDIGESDFADSKQHKKITNKAVDAVFSLITGEKETK